MFEKREKTPMSPTENRTQPSLEAVMALQRMFEEGRLEQLAKASESNDDTPEVQLARAETVRPSDAAPSDPGILGRFFLNLARKLGLTEPKQPADGKSASRNG